MIKCEKCKVRSDVIDTRYASKMIPPYVRRTRRCPRCDKRWTTMEMMARSAQTSRQRVKGAWRGPIVNDIRKAEYAAIADKLHALADRVAIGEIE